MIHKCTTFFKGQRIACKCIDKLSISVHLAAGGDQAPWHSLLELSCDSVSLRSLSWSQRVFQRALLLDLEVHCLLHCRGVWSSTWVQTHTFVDWQCVVIYWTTSENSAYVLASSSSLLMGCVGRANLFVASKTIQPSLKGTAEETMQDPCP